MDKKTLSFIGWTFALGYLFAALSYYVLGIRSGTGYLILWT